MNRTIIPILLSAIAVISGCESTPTETRREAMDVSMTLGESATPTDQRVTIMNGDRLNVQCVCSSGAGHRWRIADGAGVDSVIKLEDHFTLAGDNGAAAPSTSEVFRFRAISQGQARISLVYDRPNDRSQPPQPLRRIEILVVP